MASNLSWRWGRKNKVLLTPQQIVFRTDPPPPPRGRGNTEHKGSTCLAHPSASIPGTGGWLRTLLVGVQQVSMVGVKKDSETRSAHPSDLIQTCMQPETYLWTPSTKATSSGEDDMYTQDFPESGDFLGPSTSSSSFTWMVWHRQRARKNSSSRSYKNAIQNPTHLWNSSLK